MRITEAFREFGAHLAHPAWEVSAVSDQPRQVVVSLWSHAFNEDMTKYESGTAQWRGGKSVLYRHLRLAMEEGLPIRVVVATAEDATQVYEGNASRMENDFEPDFSLVGRVVRLEENELEIAFERTGQVPLSRYAKTGAKYWHLAEAVEALPSPTTTAHIKAWLAQHYPGDSRADIAENLAHLTVNDINRRHYDRSRKSWRTDSGHPRDRLFRRGKNKATTYEPFRAATHGHWDLRPGVDGKWEAYQLPTSELALAEAQAQEEAFEHLPPVSSDHDARVWTLTTIAQRQGQGAFRAQILDAYGSRCAITGCTAVAVLEAAHIVPYRGEHTHRIDNGILLRSDIHTLFDLGLLWICEQLRIAISDVLRGTEYEALEGKTLRLPSKKEQHPNPAHLAAQAQLAKDKQR